MQKNKWHGRGGRETVESVSRLERSYVWVDSELVIIGNYLQGTFNGGLQKLLCLQQCE
jgi:hypothetical protein